MQRKRQEEDAKDKGVGGVGGVVGGVAGDPYYEALEEAERLRGRGSISTGEGGREEGGGKVGPSSSPPPDDDDDDDTEWQLSVGAGALPGGGKDLTPGRTAAPPPPVVMAQDVGVRRQRQQRQQERQQPPTTTTTVPPRRAIPMDPERARELDDSVRVLSRTRDSLMRDVEVLSGGGDRGQGGGGGGSPPFGAPVRAELFSAPAGPRAIDDIDGDVVRGGEENSGGTAETAKAKAGGRKRSWFRRLSIRLIGKERRPKGNYRIEARAAAIPPL